MFTCVVDPPPGTAPCQQSPNGTYPTLAACNATCIPPPQFYKCVVDVPTPTGRACQPCAATDPNATSFQFCNSTCVAPPPPPAARYRCDRDAGRCVAVDAGAVDDATALEVCEAGCVRRGYEYCLERE